MTILQELSTKWGVKPEYEFMSRDGPVHDPVFEYRVSVGEYSATGKGKNDLLQAVLWVLVLHYRVLCFY